jgi:AraC-like DNA-binding protein
MHEDIYSFLQGDLEEAEFYIEMTGISYCDESYRISRKSSEIYVFEYILEGEGTVICDGKVFTAVKGDVYILKRKSSHEYYSHKDKPWTKIWFNAKGTLIEMLFSLYNLNHLMLLKDVPLSPFFFRILETAKSTDNNRDFERASALIFFDMILCLKELHFTDTAVKSEEALLLKTYLDKHNKEQVSIDELSKLIYRSTSQTIRIFRQAFGITPYKYLMKQKMELAKLLLLNTNMTIKEISLDLNFHDEHYFSNYFKDNYGLSPLNYRKTN